MKRKLTLLLLSPIIFSMGCKNSNNQKSSTPVDVVIISGQSNGVGCSHSEELMTTMGLDKYEEYRTGYEEIKIAYDCWTKDWPASGITFYSQNTSGKKNFVKTRLGQGNGPYTFGPEIGIVEELKEKYANKLFLIKFACGGSNLKDDWLGRTSIMYTNMMKYVKAQLNNLIESGYKPTVKAFCWMQGEGDSYPGYYDVYLDNLRQFVSDLRTDFKEYTGENEMAFIDAGISNAKVWQFYKEVNEAKANFAKESENNIYIDTIAAGMHTDKEPWNEPDIYHYDSDSEILLGHLFAQSFEKYLSK